MPAVAGCGRVLNQEVTPRCWTQEFHGFHRCRQLPAPRCSVSGLSECLNAKRGFNAVHTKKGSAHGFSYPNRHYLGSSGTLCYCGHLLLRGSQTAQIRAVAALAEGHRFSLIDGGLTANLKGYHATLAQSLAPADRHIADQDIEI